VGARIGTNSKIGTGGRNEDYYINELAQTQQEYYTGRGEAAGEWAGGLAKRLGLAGQLTPEQFCDALEGVHPVTGEFLKPVPNLKTRGLDVTFDLPKSFSALYALAGEPTRAVIHAAVREALDRYAVPYLEEYACVARLGAQGKDRVPGTGFLVSLFTHRQSREGDPHLHVHAIFANVAWTEDGRAAAPDLHMLYAHHKAAGGLFEAGVRHVLARELGLAFEERGGQLEISGIPAELCHLWSTRRAQVQAQADEWGSNSAAARQAAAYATRKTKEDTPVDERGLHAGWRDQAAEWDRHRDRGRAARRPFGPDYDRLAETLAHQAERAERAQVVERLSDEQIADRLTGPEGLTDKASSFAVRDIALGAARLLHAGDATPERVAGLVKQVLADGRVLDLLSPGRATSGELMQLRGGGGRVTRAVRQHERRYTTAELRQAEQEVCDRAAGRHGGGVAVVPAQVVDEVIGRYNAANPGKELDEGQQAAVRGICGSGNGVDVVIGRAGTGKSATMNAARECFEQVGTAVVGVAPTATAAHLLGRSARLGESSTVHRMLASLDRDHDNGKAGLAQGCVVVCDEASMADTRTLLRLLREVDAVGGKLVAVGDDRQIPSVDVGGLLPHIAQICGAYELTRNYRFDRVEMRDAAEAVRDGNTREGIDGLRELGMVHEHDDHEDTLTAMVHRWSSARAARAYPGCERVFEVSGQGVAAEVATPAGRREPADVRMYADLNRTCDELNRRARKVLVAGGEVGQARLFADPQTGRTVAVGEGDQVVLNHNVYGLSQPGGDTVTVRNGMRGQAVQVTAEGIRVRLDGEHVGEGGPRTVWLDSGYTAAQVSLGYACTVDKGEGATHDASLYTASDRSSLERGYVALTRGRAWNELFVTKGQAWEHALATPRAHEPAISQQPTEQRVQAQRPVERQRDRWLADRTARLETQPQATHPNRGQDPGQDRGRGIAI